MRVVLFFCFVSVFLPFRVVISLCRCKETVSVVHFLIFTCGLTEIHHKSGSTVFITSSLIGLSLSLHLSLSIWVLCVSSKSSEHLLSLSVHTHHPLTGWGNDSYSRAHTHTLTHTVRPPHNEKVTAAERTTSGSHQGALLHFTHYRPLQNLNHECLKKQTARLMHLTRIKETPGAATHVSGIMLRINPRAFLTALIPNKY